jgi:lipopolysaccharide/colanic/teichoic acid biosynthesis glycosyltransferase
VMKRGFDISISLVGLAILSPLLVLAAVMIKLDSPGPVVFKQRRVGKGFRPFLIYKFRTMVNDAPAGGLFITVGRDPRITRLGKLLRMTKIDELPQLVNVLKGDMTFVGPRPEVSRYVELFREDYEEILKVRPGITDLASLKYSNEAAMLGQFENPEQEYVMRVLPEKIELAKEYIRQSSLLFDLTVILRTLRRLVEFKYHTERTSV